MADFGLVYKSWLWVILVSQLSEHSLAENKYIICFDLRTNNHMFSISSISMFRSLSDGDSALLMTEIASSRCSVVFPQMKVAWPKS